MKQAKGSLNRKGARSKPIPPFPRRDSPGRNRRLTLRRRWAADGRLRAEWDQTALIVAKIHNAHYTKPIQPWEIGPYAADPEERKLALGDVAGLLKGLPGVTVEEVPETTEMFPEMTGAD